VYKKALYVTTLAVAGLLMTPGESSAQRLGRVGRGGWSGGSGGWGGNRWDGGQRYDDVYGFRYYDMPDSSRPQLSYYYTPPTLAYGGEEQEALSNAANRALIQLRVPNNAEVFFEGEKTNQTGPQRRFVSPPLQVGTTFTYDVRARWMDDSGKPVEKTQQVKVQAGRRSMVDFLTASDTKADKAQPADKDKDKLPEPKQPKQP
jgi:uncharacterized protein (TIGR03000 family)